jgi:2-polyprenyl-3-methyl-5-hydroxy-6-metoxy-1,4-benzoquinol methylase
VTDAIFAEARLADIYDLVEGERDDLDHYLAMATEYDARSVLDVGCGTGTLACLLADRGIEVVGVDPAAASLDVARAKPGLSPVRSESVGCMATRLTCRNSTLIWRR